MATEQNKFKFDLTGEGSTKKAPQKKNETFGIVINPDGYNDGGLVEFWENKISNAVVGIPTNPTKLKLDKYNAKEKETGELFEFSVRCIQRGKAQVSLFPELDEIKLTDRSKRIFVSLLKQSYNYFRINGNDIENLVVNITPETVSPFLQITFDKDPKKAKNQKKELRRDIKTFFEEIDKIRIIADYTYPEKKDGKNTGRILTDRFDGGIFINNTKVERRDDKGNIIQEGRRINPDFYYSLARCYSIMQIPFTAFAVRGKNAFSLIFDLYKYSRIKGESKISTRTILNNLGFLGKEKESINYAQRIKGQVLNILDDALGQALTSYKFVNESGREIDPGKCTNREFIESFLVWEQITPSETDKLIESRQELQKKLDYRRPRASKRRAPKK